jgi:hypothetical protein
LSKILDNAFKFLVLFFWSIVWFNWQFLSTQNISISLFLIYLTLSLIYILAFTYNFISINFEKIKYFYRLSTISTFIFASLYFLLFPKSLFLLFIKIIFEGFYLYFSCIKVYKYHLDEGVVGILSVLLLGAITIIY